MQLDLFWENPLVQRKYKYVKSNYLWCYWNSKLYYPHNKWRYK